MSQKCKEINNLKIKDLPKALKRETLTPCFYCLIENAEANCIALNNAGIKYSNDLFEMMSTENGLVSIATKTNIPKDYITGLFYLHNSFSFKPIRLKKLEIINTEHIEKLELKK